MTPTQMTAALAIHSARAEPIIPEGRQTPAGYILWGPHGTLGCVEADANGNVNDDRVRLWLDGIAYVDAWAAKRAARASTSGAGR